jgi:hypothetical protein
MKNAKQTAAMESTVATGTAAGGGETSPRGERGGGESELTTPREQVAKEPKLLTPKEVSSGEQQFVKKLLEATCDEVVGVHWVTKVNAHGESQARLIVVGLYRVYTIKRRWNGKKEVRRDGHYLDLAEIVTLSPDHVVLHFTREYMKEPFIVDAHGAGIGDLLPREIAAAMRRWAFDLPASKMPKVTTHTHTHTHTHSSKQATLNMCAFVCCCARRVQLKRERGVDPAADFAAPKPPADSMGGFIAMYRSMSNYEALAPSDRVIKYVPQ